MINIIILLIACLTASIIIIYKDRSKHKTKMSFREGLDLTDIPVVTFNINNKKANFVLDTGASSSVINEECLKDFDYVVSDKDSGKVTGIDGVKRDITYVDIILNYKDIEYPESFMVTDLSDVFNIIKEETGVNLNGIIGTSFMQKYRYILDFKELVAYR